MIRRAASWLMVLIFALSSMVGSFASAAETAEQQLGRGIAAYYQNRAADAHQSLTSAIDAGCQEPQAFYFRGLSLLRLARQDEALKDFEQGAQLEVGTGSIFTLGHSLERVQGRDRLLLQQARDKARVLSAQQREKERMAKYEIKLAPPPAAGQIAATAPAATATPTTTPSADPFAAPAKPAAPADPFSTPAKPAAPTTTPTPPPAPAATTPAPATAPAPATTVAAAPAAAAAIKLSDAPDAALRELATLTANGKPHLAWQAALPPKYQQDVQAVIREFGAKMDKDIWEKSFTMLGKVMKIIQDKRDFIFAHPLVTQLIDSVPPEQKAQIEQAKIQLGAVATAFDGLLKSEISTVEGLQKLDVNAFLAGPLTKFSQDVATLSAKAENKTLDAWAAEQAAKLKITVVSADADNAELTLEQPGAPPQNVKLKKVEGRWLPAVMVDGWDANIAQAKAAIAMLEIAGPQKDQFLALSGIVDNVLEGLLKANDQDAFNMVVGSIMALAQQFIPQGAPPPM